MTQYDAGPGDWSDREWEMPGREQKDQVRKRRISLPPWAMLAALVAAVVLLCVGLVLIVKAIRGGRQAETPTAVAAETDVVSPQPSAELSELQPTLPPLVAPSPTYDLGSTLSPAETEPVFAEIARGATVVTTNTTQRLNLRAEPNGRIVGSLASNTVLEVVGGPEDAGGYTWWQVRKPDGSEGWVAADWLKLQD